MSIVIVKTQKVKAYILIHIFIYFIFTLLLGKDHQSFLRKIIWNSTTNGSFNNGALIDKRKNLTVILVL